MSQSCHRRPRGTTWGAGGHCFKMAVSSRCNQGCRIALVLCWTASARSSPVAGGGKERKIFFFLPIYFLGSRACVCFLFLPPPPHPPSAPTHKHPHTPPPPPQ